MTGRLFIIGIAADPRFDTARFERTQSPSMAARDWEREPQWASWLAGLFAAIFVGVCIFFL